MKTMKMGDIVTAGTAMKKIAAQDLPIKTAYAVYRIVKGLDVHLEFHDEKWRTVLEEHCTMDEENGRWIPKTDNDKKAIEAAKAELYAIEVEVEDYKEVEIPASADVKLSAFDIVALEGFIEIKFEEENNGNQ